MSEIRPPRQADRSDAAWAHNRWPTIGIYTGAGVGVVLGITFFAGWLWTLLYVVGLALAGGIVGFLLALFVYRGSEEEKGDGSRF